MATLTITLSPAAPNPGQTVTATYGITGADATDRVLTVTGNATLDGQALTATGSFTLSHVKAYQAPTVSGLTFAPTADPKVWTAVCPSA